jgi:aryl-alcohol dehydrogenase-like predicted oxidoreductase
VNVFDNAWEYNDGRSEEWLGQALAGKRDRAVLMTKVCTHGRGRAEARLAHDFPVDAQQVEIKEDLADAAGKASAK